MRASKSKLPFIPRVPSYANKVSTRNLQFGSELPTLRASQDEQTGRLSPTEMSMNEIYNMKAANKPNNGQQ